MARRRVAVLADRVVELRVLVGHAQVGARTAPPEFVPEHALGDRDHERSQRLRRPQLQHAAEQAREDLLGNVFDVCAGAERSPCHAADERQESPPGLTGRRGITANQGERQLGVAAGRADAAADFGGLGVHALGAVLACPAEQRSNLVGMAHQYRDPREPDQRWLASRPRIIQAPKRLTFTGTAPRSRPLGWVALLLAALAGCGEQEIRAIEALPLPAPSGSSTTAPDPPDPPDDPADDPPDVPGLRDRGRVQVRDGNLLTDKGTRLRGVTLGIDNTSPGVHVAPSLFKELSGQAGLNAFHIYLENSTEVSGLRAAEADELVELTSAAGMYLVLGIGGGRTGGRFDIDKVRSFWTFYAPRYASRTHVLYEIQNVPDTACDHAYDSETLAMEQEIYGLIRELAPSTHVALFSFVSQPTGAALEANLTELDSVVDWSKASVAFHTQDCAGKSDLAELLAVTRPRGIAAFASEMLFRTSFESTAQLEAERVGWFNFEWLVLTRDLSAFREAHTAANITWCPDFGTWPEDSETCSTP